MELVWNHLDVCHLTCVQSLADQRLLQTLILC